MTEAERVIGGLNPDHALRVFEFDASRPGQLEVVSDEARGWLALEESQSTFAFAELEGYELRILPFLGDVDATRALPFVQSIDDSWLDGSHEIVIQGTGRRGTYSSKLSRSSYHQMNRKRARADATIPTDRSRAEPTASALCAAAVFDDALHHPGLHLIECLHPH